VRLRSTITACIMLAAAGCTGATSSVEPPPPSAEPPPPARVVVPRLKALYEHDGVSRLESRGLLARVVGHKSNVSGPWQIVSQTKLPGTRVLSGTQVSFKVVALRRVPDVTGRSLQVAIAILHDRGLVPPIFSGVNEVQSDLPPGTVVRTSPQARAMVHLGGTVRLAVSKADCDPSYPDVCIPPPPPYLNCDDVPYTNIRVVGSDPHGFDGYDNDGIGCET
jgi:PASTA domain